MNKAYLSRGDLRVQQFGRGFTWLDAGANESLLKASQFVETIETRQIYKIVCLEEIEFNQGCVSADQLLISAKFFNKNSCGDYVLSLILD